MEINETVARKVLETVDAGLTRGKGQPVLGRMCVEAAVCFAMGLPHSDDPPCVSPALRALKIALNDIGWLSDAARARGLRRLAVAQLGSVGVLDEAEFCKRVAEMTIRKYLSIALRASAGLAPPAHAKALRAAADRCDKEGTREAVRAAANAAADAADAAYAAYAAADAAAYAYAAAAADAAYTADAARAAAAGDKVLGDFAESVVQILITMKAPGCQWLPLTEAAA